MKQKIDNLFMTREEIPLFYIEGGSRLMDIQNSESDYDIRGFHLQSKRKYFDFKVNSEVIDYKENNIDLVSYDIDKMFRLILNSNPSTFEHIRAETIYFNQFPDWSNFKKAIIENINYKTLFHSYISLANGNKKQMEANKNFTYKTVFYCIHGLLSAELVSKQIIPELKVENLFSQFKDENNLIKIAKDSLLHKEANEQKSDVNQAEKDYILSTINSYLLKLKVNIPEVNKQEKLENVLSTYSINLKEHFYI